MKSNNSNIQGFYSPGLDKKSKGLSVSTSGCYLYSLETEDCKETPKVKRALQRGRSRSMINVDQGGTEGNIILSVLRPIRRGGINVEKISGNFQKKKNLLSLTNKAVSIKKQNVLSGFHKLLTYLNLLEISRQIFLLCIPVLEGSKERQTLEMRLKKRSLPLSRGLLQLQEIKLKSKSLDLTERWSEKKKKEVQGKASLENLKSSVLMSGKK